MSITRDEKFPAEAAQLMAGFSRLSDGYSMQNVVDASVNMTGAAIVAMADSRALTEEEFLQYIQAIQKAFFMIALDNRNRKPQPTDIPVGTN